MRISTGLILILMFILPVSMMPIMVFAAEPSLQEWFSENTYSIDVATNKTSVATFPPGNYRVTIIGEFAMYAPNNTFGWYSVATGTLHQLFTGPDSTGAMADFSPAELFGFYLGSPDGTFYTNKTLNPDATNHAWIFEDPKTQGGYIISWEDLLFGGDEDYQDMIIAMRALHLPHALFNWYPPNPMVNQTVTFDGSDSTPGEGNLATYQWNFGDENTTTTITPITTHVYSTSGNYTAILNVTNNEGKSDSVSHTITVAAPPHAAFTYSPLNPQVNETITFDASTSTPDGGTITNYSWNFGDGNTTTASASVITHVFHAYGNYTITLNITDTELKSDSVSHNITVAARPHAAFTFSPLHPQVNDMVTFNASASTPDGGAIASYSWNFRDGNITAVSSPTVTHAYATYGNYTVTLNVTDTEQKSDAISQTIVVIGPPHAAFIYSPAKPEVNQTVTFDASTSTPDGGTITNYSWNFGDGNASATTVPTITHVYRSYGNYTVTLNVTDTEQKSDSVSHTITVIACPDAAFTYLPLNPKVNDTITFNASASTPDGGIIVSYRWNFSDGSPSAFGVVVTHSYTVDGSYTVTLNVTDSEGKWDTESKTIVVQKPPPEPEFDVKIEDEWTLPGDEYVFTGPVYGKTFKAEVQVTNALDLYGYEFWLQFDPTIIQLTQYEILHIHTADSIALQEVDNLTGMYKQAVTATAPAQPYDGTAPVATIWFRFIREPCYPYNFTSMLTLNHTKMTNQNGSAIENLQKHGYFKILAAMPQIGIEHDGQTGFINWIDNSTFTVDVNLTNIIRMRGFYIEITWGNCLETDIQNVAVTDFLPPPYEVYQVNITDTGMIIQVRISLEKPPINGTGTIITITFKAKNPWGGTPPYTRIGDTYVPDNCTCNVEIVTGWIDAYCPDYRRMDFYNSSYGINVKDKFKYVFTPIPGDINLDGQVDTTDLSTISQWMGYQYGDPEWPEIYRYDLNGDGRIDLFDVVIVSSNMGRTHP
jgi:PKD repeat protein